MNERSEKQSNERTEERVLADLGTMIRQVIAEDWAEEVPIEMETSFSRDLELESIEFVALAEQLKSKFGKNVDFAGWLGSMELEQILRLRVGQLVEFIVRCSSVPIPA
ncbi:MAG TPA: hypothetical protein VNO21_23505 [Polyangiaceae bacterium]|nr:hypothetical protein [Polyangiaceae bacterium]